MDVRKIELTADGARKRGRRRARTAARLAAWLIGFAALYLIPNGFAGLFVVLLGPWMGAADGAFTGKYLLAAGYTLMGFASALIVPLAWILAAPAKRRHYTSGASASAQPPAA